MHLYLRIIQEHGPENYSAEEEQRLHDCLSAAPGIEAVKELTRHPRGGYGIGVEQSDDALDRLGEYLAACGYRVVI